MGSTVEAPTSERQRRSRRSKRDTVKDKFDSMVLSETSFLKKKLSADGKLVGPRYLYVVSLMRETFDSGGN